MSLVDEKKLPVSNTAKEHVYSSNFNSEFKYIYTYLQKIGFTNEENTKDSQSVKLIYKVNVSVICRCGGICVYLKTQLSAGQSRRLFFSEACRSQLKVAFSAHASVLSTQSLVTDKEEQLSGSSFHY